MPDELFKEIKKRLLGAYLLTEESYYVKLHIIINGPIGPFKDLRIATGWGFRFWITRRFTTLTDIFAISMTYFDFFL